MVAFSTERKWLRGNIEKFMMLNRRRRLHQRVISQQVCELFFGAYIFNVDLWVHVLSVEQPIERDSVGSGNVFYHWTSSFDDHLDHCLIVFKYVQLCLTLRRICVCDHVIEI